MISGRPAASGGVVAAPSAVLGTPPAQIDGRDASSQANSVYSCAATDGCLSSGFFNAPATQYWFGV